MNLRRSGQELLHDQAVQIDSRLRDHVSDRFDVLLEVLEFLIDHGAEYSLDLGFLQGIVDSILNGRCRRKVCSKQ